jgi:ribosome-binding factor A
MANARRKSRLASVLRTEVAELFLHEVRDEALREVNITDVELTADLKLARVYFAADRQTPKAVDGGLRRVTPWVRAKLAERLAMRSVPQLEFRRDEHASRVASLYKAFDAIAAERGDVSGS